ncbi:MAG: hypothetical protein IJV38_03260 [Prevotella sp.]|nr:hypothetical protein [Prevotella sp.]
MKTRILSILALLLMAVTGAWAQTEGLLTSITTDHFETITYSTAGCATLTTSGNVDVSEVADDPTELYGWTNSTSTMGSLTVTPSEGYTITKVVFKGYEEDEEEWLEVFTDTEAPYTCYMESSAVSLSETMDNSDTYKICQIDVYGYASNPTVTANEGATGEYWATYYNGTTSFTADANTTVYQAAVNSGKTAVVLTEVTGREIPAGKGVVLKSSAATITLTPTTTTQTLEGNELTGVDVATAAPSNAYCLSKETTGSARGVGFYTYTGTIPAHRAYLVVAGGPSLARGFLGFGDDDNTTGISLPEAVVIENDGPIYDLYGRRIIGQQQKGIYVKNGKKVVIK